MAHYKVPALSMAFVENGRVMWSRAYGVGDVANGTRATVDTLFQAASISKPSRHWRSCASCRTASSRSTKTST